MNELLKTLFGSNFNITDEESFKEFLTIGETWYKTILQNEQKRKEEKQKQIEAWFENCPYKLELIQFDSDYKKRWNIDDKSKFYYITDKANRRLFEENMFSFVTREDIIRVLGALWDYDINGQRKYIIANVYCPSTYSDSVAKSCNLRYKNRYVKNECVINTWTKEIVYWANDCCSINKIHIYGNIMKTEENKIIHLPSMNVLVEKNKCKKLYKDEKCVYAVTEENYSDDTMDKIKIFDKITGNRVDDKL